MGLLKIRAPVALADFSQKFLFRRSPVIHKVTDNTSSSWPCMTGFGWLIPDTYIICTRLTQRKNKIAV